MLYPLRLVVVILYFLCFCAAIIPLLLLRPFHADNTHTALRLFYPAHRLLNFHVHCLAHLPQKKPVIYIANHQNLLDIFLFGPIWPKNNSVIGKKSIIWIPFFGVAYWLSGNVFINRENKSKAWALVEQVVETVGKKQRSFLFMPEGTRSKGRGLLPFKKGAFLAAIKAGVPIVPICASTTADTNLNQWCPKPAFVTYLKPIETAHLSEDDAPALAHQR